VCESTLEVRKGALPKHLRQGAFLCAAVFIYNQKKCVDTGNKQVVYFVYMFKESGRISTGALQTIMKKSLARQMEMKYDIR